MRVGGPSLEGPSQLHSVDFFRPATRTTCATAYINAHDTHPRTPIFPGMLAGYI